MSTIVTVSCETATMFAQCMIPVGCYEYHAVLYSTSLCASSLSSILEQKGQTLDQPRSSYNVVFHVLHYCIAKRSEYLTLCLFCFRCGGEFAEFAGLVTINKL